MDTRAATVVLVLAALAALASGAGDWAATPPRGWNSYNSFIWVVTEQEFLANCEAVARLLPTYEYCVVDFRWFQAFNRSTMHFDQWGRPVPAPDRWPSGFRAVSDRVHAMGLKFGIHTMRGMLQAAYDADTPIKGATDGSTARDIGLTSQKCLWWDRVMSVDVSKPAGKLFYDSLYELYAEWGVDFVKNDCVHGADLSDGEIAASAQSIAKTGREIVYSLSPGATDRATSGAQVKEDQSTSLNVNMYRLTNDDWDNWGDLNAHFDVAKNYAAAGLVGSKGLFGRSWPDMDMLPVGYLSDAKSQDMDKGPYRWTSLTYDEQRTQMTLWSIFRSPIMMGGDMRVVDEWTLSLLTNAEVLEINTDSWNNTQLDQTQHTRVWSASGSGGRIFAALFNTDGSKQTAVLRLGLLGVGRAKVRDLWDHKELGTIEGSFSVELPAHGCRLVSLVPF